MRLFTSVSNNPDFTWRNVSAVEIEKTKRANRIIPVLVHDDARGDSALGRPDKAGGGMVVRQKIDYQVDGRLGGMNLTDDDLGDRIGAGETRRRIDGRAVTEANASRRPGQACK